MKNSNEKLMENPIKEKVSAFYELMKSEKLEELEIKEEDFYIHIKRKGKISQPSQVAVAAQSVPVIKNIQEEDSQGKAPVLEGEEIKSPISGVFYRSPSPSSPPFVKDGDVADKDKTLCIVEAMKVMNEIKAENKIKILKILVENGKPVSSGQTLFLVERK